MPKGYRLNPDMPLREAVRVIERQRDAVKKRLRTLEGALRGTLTLGTLANNHGNRVNGNGHAPTTRRRRRRRRTAKR